MCSNFYNLHAKVILFSDISYIIAIFIDIYQEKYVYLTYIMKNFCRIRKFNVILQSKRGE